MSRKVFNNEILDNWLEKKTNDILLKIEKEPLNSEEMILLSLKAQTNHFHHMDDEFRREFKSIKEQFKEVNQQFKEIDQRFKEVNQRFEKIDQRFEKLEEKFDKKFDRFSQIMMWGFGTMIACFMGVFIELLKK